MMTHDFKTLCALKEPALETELKSLILPICQNGFKETYSCPLYDILMDLTKESADEAPYQSIWEAIDKILGIEEVQALNTYATAWLCSFSAHENLAMTKIQKGDFDTSQFDLSPIYTMHNLFSMSLDAKDYNILECLLKHAPKTCKRMVSEIKESESNNKKEPTALLTQLLFFWPANEMLLPRISHFTLSHVMSANRKAAIEALNRACLTKQLMLEKGSRYHDNPYSEKNLIDQFAAWVARSTYLAYTRQNDIPTPKLMMSDKLLILAIKHHEQTFYKPFEGRRYDEVEADVAQQSQRTVVLLGAKGYRQNLPLTSTLVRSKKAMNEARDRVKGILNDFIKDKKIPSMIPQEQRAKLIETVSDCDKLTTKNLKSGFQKALN